MDFFDFIFFLLSIPFFILGVENTEKRMNQRTKIKLIIIGVLLSVALLMI
jgi:hypothetical protein